MSVAFDFELFWVVGGGAVQLPMRCIALGVLTEIREWATWLARETSRDGACSAKGAVNVRPRVLLVARP